MKQLAIFILILVCSPFTRVAACGFYLYGDDVRFTLLKPEVFHYPQFLEFNYTTDYSYFNDRNNNHLMLGADTLDSNVELWRMRCKNKVSYPDTYRTIYGSGGTITQADHSNSFVQYLYQNKDVEAIDYLNFAKKCGPLNALIDDPWERHEYANVPQRSEYLKEALVKANTVVDKDIQRRYAFLAIRLAYYSRDYKQITAIYDQYFDIHQAKNTIDYWSMYFRTYSEKDSIKHNFLAAQVFLYAPDKRYHIFQTYNKWIDAEHTLAYAKSEDEKLAVWTIAGLKSLGRSLPCMKRIYALRPYQKGLSFMLLREINKLEDWIYTPYYSNFNPSIDYENEKPYPMDRIASDRKYAKEVLDFVNSADYDKVENPILWKFAKAYLAFMAEDYKTCSTELVLLKKMQILDQEVARQIKILKVLCLTAQQKKNATIVDEAKKVLMDELASKNRKFVFAVSRELEYSGNTNDGAILMSKLNEKTSNRYDYEGCIYWKTKADHRTLLYDFYDDYFFYLDAQYTSKQMADLIKKIKEDKSEDIFSKWKYAVIKKDLPRLYDLMGTKYMRSNDLQSALKCFRQVNDTLWKSKHYPYQVLLNVNPFYTNLYNEHTKTKADSFKYNKPEIVKQLIDYLRKADDVTNKQRDYYYFLVANCYFNMTQYGNSWMMKRYFWSVHLERSKLEDDNEYFKCLSAQKFYLKAKRESRNRKFAALCLRMAGRCEKYKLEYEQSKDDYYSNKPLPKNIYYIGLKNQYGAYYDDLMSNCNSFETYFNSRN